MRELAPFLPVLGGRFRLTRLLGEGGMGVVWEAVHTDGRRMAIKFLRDASPDLQKRFFREAEAANAVRHPCIVHVHELARDDDGTPAFVMDLLEGESLAVRIERLQRLPLGQTAAILVPAIEALRAAHRAGVVHRDMKPDNVFLAREADGRTGVRLLDFGIARLTRPGEKLTVTGTLMGTPLYMSPEQASGEAVDARTDVWSMAAVVFECLTGTTPVTGENYGQVLSRLIRRDVQRLADLSTDLPPDVVHAIDAHFVDRAQRPADLGTLSEVLARYADPVVHAPPAVLAPAPAQSAHRVGRDDETMLDASTGVRPPARATPILIGVAAVVVALATGAGTFALLRRPVAATPPAATASAAVASPADEPPPPPVAVPPLPAEPPPVASSVAAPAARPAPSASAKRVPGKSQPGRLSGGVADAPGY